ncbi:hypothetical protein V8G54_025298 [Vigna mungo]|uniref:Protein kinase domain-containing protein n=1 Tax=Vigna mungo TaxID=3915 RepID=A0AAQ3N8G8_VIGMU
MIQCSHFHVQPFSDWLTRSHGLELQFRYGGGYRTRDHRQFHFCDTLERKSVVRGVSVFLVELGQRKNMGCFCCAGKSCTNSDTEEYGQNFDQKPSNFTAAESVKVDFKVNGKKEDGSKGDQLALDVKSLNLKEEGSQDERDNGNRAQSFSFNELEAATGNFTADCFLGEGGFGKVYKGHLERINQVVAIKQLDPNGLQGIREFAVEVLTLSLADHPNLVKLIGFCAEGEQRLLVYEFMPLGSLENHLLDVDKFMSLWPSLCSTHIPTHFLVGLNILQQDCLDSQLHGLSLDAIVCVEESLFFCVLSCVLWPQLLLQSSLSAFLCSTISGQLARPLFRDRKKFPQMVDPLLEGRYPVRGLYQALAIAAMCVQEQPNMRPVIVDVVTALNYLASQKYDPQFHPAQSSRRSPPSQVMQRDDDDQRRLILSTEHVTDRS